MSGKRFSLDLLRSYLALYLPILIAAAYAGTGGWDNSAGFVGKWVEALLIGGAAWVVGYAGILICLALVRWISPGEEPGPEGPELGGEHIAAGILLGVVVWIWCQSDHRETIDQLVQCVDENSWELEAMEPGELVEMCYRNRGRDSDRWDY